jgi:hypothetical protein
MSGVITPKRTKNMAKPVPLAFEVEIASIDGTEQTTTVLRESGVEIPDRLEPAITALRKLSDFSELTQKQVNGCLDATTNNRTSRARYKKELEDIGVLISVVAEAGAASRYRFEDPAVSDPNVS